MRIAVLNWRDSAHPDAGGAEVFVDEVGRRFAEMGHEVRLFSSKTRQSLEIDYEIPFKIERVGFRRAGSHHVFAPARVSRWKPQVVLESINTLPYLLPWRFQRIPYLSLFHQLAVDVWDHHLPGPLPVLARLGERAALMPYRSVGVAAVSESTKADLERSGFKKVTVVPQGGLGRCTQESKESSPTLMFVGRLVENKRPHHALEAFRRIKAQLPEARLWMVGEGPLKEQLMQDLPSDVELLGRIPRSELLERMSRAHVMLCTSVREGWGLVITEANAMGTPAVAYDVPGYRDSVRHGKTGLLTAGDPAAMAEAAISLLSQTSTYSSVRASSIEWGAAHSWVRTTEFLLELLRRRAHVTDRADPVSAGP